MGNTVRTIVIVDMSWQSDEDEIPGIIRILKMYMPGIELVAGGNGFTEDILGVPADLLVIDYGGASVMGSPGLASFNVREACKWAENHPGKLVIMWTDFTQRIYKDEFQQTFGHLDNIEYRFENTTDADYKRIAKWYEVE